jgi:flagellar protein FlbD
VIQLTRLNNTDLWLNPVLIESLERTPDTIVTLTNGHKYVVLETPDIITERIAAFLRSIGIVGVAAGTSERKGEGA